MITFRLCTFGRNTTELVLCSLLGPAGWHMPDICPVTNFVNFVQFMWCLPPLFTVKLFFLPCYLINILGEIFWSYANSPFPIKLSILFVYISMGSCCLFINWDIIFSIISYFSAQMWQLVSGSSLEIAYVFFQHVPIILWILTYSLAQQYDLGSTLYLPCPSLNWPFLQKDLVPSTGEWYYLSARSAYWFWGNTASCPVSGHFRGYLYFLLLLTFSHTLSLTDTHTSINFRTYKLKTMILHQYLHFQYTLAGIA